MPTTPIYALPYPAAADPADVPLDMQELAEQVAKVLGGALSATPPASPIEGQLWATSPAAGVVWVLRYNAGSASPYKWEGVGGNSLYQELRTSGTYNSGTYGDLAGGGTGPTVTLPFAGDYEIAHGGQLNPASFASAFVAMSYAIGATAAIDADAVWAGTPAAAALTANPSRTTRKTFAAAGTALVAKYRTGGGTGTVADRWLSARPIRVG